jgi:hypothetical protein
MSDTAQNLVEQLVTAEGWVDPDVLEAILEQGDAAIPSLREAVRREEEDWAEPESLGPACLLLGSLGASSAIPDLVQLFYHYDSELLEDVAQALVILGAESVEPALAVVRDETLGWYARAMASNAAVDASAQDPELRAHVTATLRELVADYVARAETLTGDEVDAATFLVTDLALAADPEARDLIEAAFEADIVDEGMINRRTVEQSYREGERPAPPPDPRAWLPRYRIQYREHLGLVRRLEREAQEPQPRPVSARQREGPKLGRNDPCWCGSGKKYKYCHMRQDQGR